MKVFEMACLRKIEGVTRRDRIRNEDISRRVGMNQDILSRIQQRRLMTQGCKTTDTQRLPCMVASRVNGAEEGQRKDGLTQLEVTARNIQEALHHAEDRTSWKRSTGRLLMRASASPRQ